jgi:hypothetical protein
MQVSQVFLYVCCKCFILMFAYVYNGYTRVFKSFCVLQVFHVCCKCFSYLGRMLQVFHLNVAKIDRVLYMLQSQCWCRSGGVGPTWARKMQARARVCVGVRNGGPSTNE